VGSRAGMCGGCSGGVEAEVDEERADFLRITALALVALRAPMEQGTEVKGRSGQGGRPSLTDRRILRWKGSRCRSLR
jgi:hypothetical protein